VFIGSPIGLILANVAMVAATSWSGPDFLVWGWRIPFLLSVVLVGIGLYVRLRVDENLLFERREAVKLPVARVLRESWRRVLLAAGVNFGFQIFIFVLSAWLISYGRRELAVPANTMLIATVIGSLGQALTVPLFARLSDRVGRLPVMLGGAIFIGLFAFPMFWLLDVRYVVLAMVLGFVGSGALFGPTAAYYAELFATRVRYTGVALSYQLGAVLGGGLSPFVAQWLLGFKLGAWPIALYLIFGAAVSVVCLLAIGSTHEVEPARGQSDREPLTPVEA
jgi:MFS transporter, MHS family, shikimate and dehydroshikimate transport protein